MSDMEAKESSETQTSHEPIHHMPLFIIAMSAKPLTGAACAMCEAWTKPNGVDLMLADTRALVCRTCGLAYAPSLAMLIILADAAHGFAYSHGEMFPEESGRSESN